MQKQKLGARRVDAEWSGPYLAGRKADEDGIGEVAQEIAVAPWIASGDSAGFALLPSSPVSP